MATVLASGTRLTKAGAAFVNAEMILAGGKWDTFRMLTHPGSAILPAALAVAEVEGASGRDYLVAIAAGYEVMERLAADFIPTVMSRGFHAGPVFGIFGAAIAAAKLMRLDAEQIHGAIAQCVNLASGNLEGARSGGRSVREGAAVRNALLAVAMAKHGIPGGETTLEGEAGFYHAYAGNNLGRLVYSFTGQTSANWRISRPISARSGCSWRRCIASTPPRATTSPMSTSPRSSARSTTSSRGTWRASRRSSTGSRRCTRVRHFRRPTARAGLPSAVRTTTPPTAW